MIQCVMLQQGEEYRVNEVLVGMGLKVSSVISITSVKWGKKGERKQGWAVLFDDGKPLCKCGKTKS